MSTPGTTSFFALSLPIEISVPGTVFALLLWIMQTVSIIFSTIAHSLSNETVYELVDSVLEEIMPSSEYFSIQLRASIIPTLTLSNWGGVLYLWN